MVYVLIGVAVIAALLGLTKSKLGGAAKVAVLGATAVVIGLLLSIDAKFWAWSPWAARS